MVVFCKLRYIELATHSLSIRSLTLNHTSILSAVWVLLDVIVQNHSQCLSVSEETLLTFPRKIKKRKITDNILVTAAQQQSSEFTSAFDFEFTEEGVYSSFVVRERSGGRWRR